MHSKTTCTLLSLLVFGIACDGTDRIKDPDSPIRNVLFISADDHAAHALGCYGNELIRTPNLDRLAARGARFTHAYTNAPLCTPSRQSLITGRYPHASGVTLLQTPLAEEQVTIADYLKERGFQTGAVGKMHFNSQLKHGFDYRIDGADHDAYLEQKPPRKIPEGTPVKPHWNPLHDPARLYLNADTLPGNGYPRATNWERQGYYDDDFVGTYFVNRAADFIRENRKNRFCLWLSFYEPHAPYNFPVEYAGKFDPSDMPLPEMGPDDDRWVPAVFRELNEEQKRGIIASYYTSVEYLDVNVGRILRVLEEEGLDRDTLVVYVGDHGYLLGHHGAFEKQTMWDEALRIPMIVRDPRLEPSTVTALVEMLDLVPTILDTLGVDPMPTAQGRTLVPLLRGETDRHRDFIFSQYHADNLAGVRTERWKYMFTTGAHDLSFLFPTGYGPSGRHQRLFDLRQDPAEFTNLAADPQHKAVLEDLQLKMESVFLETDPRAARLPEGLSIEERLEWFLEPPEGPDTIMETMPPSYPAKAIAGAGKPKGGH